MNRYITTTLPYVNADPHIGTVVEFVQADTLARAWRAQGDEVFFTMGTDEHGQKILEAAQKAGQDVHAYVDHFSGEIERLHAALNLSNNAFIRTTNAKHYAAAQEMWRRCEAAGDIYKKTYTGMYCIGCEAFKTDKELTEDGHCLIHPSIIPQEITEENYFFALSRYQDRLIEYLNNSDNSSRVIPEWRRLEALQFVEQGLEDVSISRDKARLSWGVPVPGDDTQVMYVWFDALTNYISTLGWPEESEAGNFQKFWQHGKTLQLAGKDQVRFQSIMWQGMLMSAGIKTTDTVFYHGFINSGGQRMSKSLGNVISPYELVAKYGTDATRYMLLRHVHPVDDSDITWDRLDEWYTANLVNGLGNLVARVMKLAETHLESDDAALDGVQDLSGLSGELAGLLEHFEFNKGMDLLWKRIQEADERITREEPFKLVKTNPAEGKRILTELVEAVSSIAKDLAPWMPHTSGVILAAVRENKKPENLFPRLAE
jgi:methionyl-tRNA synthetase